MVLWKDKIGKPLARLIRKKRERIQISKIRNRKGEVTNESTEIPRIIKDYYEQLWASLVAQMVKSLPAVQETQVRSLGQEDPLEKGKAIHPSILVWRNPWTEKPSKLQSMGLQRVGHN